MELGSSHFSFLNGYTQSGDTDTRRPVSVRAIPNDAEIPTEKLSEALRNLKTPDLSHLALPEGDYPPMKVFEGNNRVLIMGDSELSARMESVLSRVPEEQGKMLIDLGLMEDDEFLKFAEQLSDKDLKNLARTATALQTPGADNGDFYFGYGGLNEVKDLVAKLQEMDPQTASRVLEKTNQLSLPVPPRNLSATYLPNGSQPQGSPAANDLHNFVKAINGIDSDDISETANAILDGLSKFADDQQSNLLQVLGSQPELGLRAMEQLGDFQKEVQDEALGYLSDLVKSLSPFAPTAPATAPNDSLGPDEWHGAVLDYDANAESVGHEMMDQYISLLEDYEFSNDQLSKMTSDLNGLDNQNQRSYLDITTTGLNNLLGGDSSQPVNLDNNQEALEVIDLLRNNETARTLVSESRMGEKRPSDNGKIYYAVKGEMPGKQDQQQTIEILTTDAWFNRHEPERITSLASKLSTLEADRRDELVDELHLLNNTEKPLSNYSLSDRDSEFDSFFERTNVIHEANDLNALLNAEEKLEDGQQDSFWQAANFLEHDTNKFIDAVNQSANHEAELLVAYISNLSDQFDQDQLSKEEALRQAAEAIDSFTELAQERQKDR